MPSKSHAQNNRTAGPGTRCSKARPPAAPDADIVELLSADEYEAILDLTHNLFARLDLGGHITKCSGPWETCLGRPRAELHGCALTELAVDADRETCFRSLQRTLAGHPTDEFSVRFENRDGGVVWLAIRARLSKRRDALHLVARDQTVEKTANAPLPSNDIILDELEEGVVIADARRKGLPVIKANSAFCNLTGYTANELRNRPIGFLVCPTTDTSKFEQAVEIALQGRSNVTEAVYRRRDGAPVWIRLHLRPVLDARGSIRHIIAVHLDVSERRLVFDALQQKNQALTEALESLQKTKEVIIRRERMNALGKMSSGIVHDFNNLLAPILGFTELLLTVPGLRDDPEKFSIYLEKIRTAANDASSVVSRLREFYRTRSDQEERSEFSLQRAAEESLDLTRHRWQNEALAIGAEIEVVADLQETAPISGWASEMRQVLTNLILNACDAMPQGGTLSVRTYPVGNWACLQIEDSGVGMDEETRRRCLEPFFTTKGQAGTGLGLAIVFGIIERHRGRMELKSAEGSGTTVTIWLPKALSEAEPPPAVESPNAAQCRAMRVLLVDDEDLLLEVVSQQLINMGHTVDAFTDPKTALECFYAKPHDIVITDRAMPGMTGDNLARLVREFAPSTPVVLLTGFAHVISQTGERVENIDEILPKPLSHRMLCEVMARHGGISSANALSA